MAEKKLAKDEITWTRYCDSKGNTAFVVTSKPSREYYMMYQCVDGGFVKLGRAKNPIELEKKFGACK